MLALVLGIQHDDSQLFTLAGFANYVLEVNWSANYGPYYLHDYNLDDLAFRYNRTGINRNQVNLDGRTVILAEVPTHSKIFMSLLAPSEREDLAENINDRI